MKRPLILLALIMLLGASLFVLNYDEVNAAGVISGTVYVDHNMNGTRNTSGIAPDLAIDSGVESVTVTVYASNGASKTTVTNAAGAYSIDTSAAPALPAGPYRVEFTNLPSGYFPSVVGSNNSTTVRVVPDGTANNIDLGIINNQAYCQNNPDVYVPRNNYGEQVFSPAALVRFPYLAGTSFTDTDGSATSRETSNYANPAPTSIFS